MRAATSVLIVACLALAGCADPYESQEPQSPAPESPEPAVVPLPDEAPPLAARPSESAEDALAAYAKRWVTWRSDELAEHNRDLARLSTGRARVEALAAARESVDEPGSSDAEGRGRVVSVGRHRREDGTYVVVTREVVGEGGQTGQLAPEHGIYEAEVKRSNGRYLVSRWQPLP